jgi:hypothetical protein
MQGNAFADNEFRMIRILLLIDYSSEFDRKLLRGLVRYSKENGPWLFYRMSSYYADLLGKEGLLEWARTWQADAIIGQWKRDDVNFLKELEIPVVLQNYHHRSTIFSNLTGDYEGTGAMAANFFIKKMYNNFAFFGINGLVWSDERREGFKKEVEKHGGDFYYLEFDIYSTVNRTAVSDWLKALPKPVALFCCDDAHALFISETCKINGIQIPEEISLLGVDNDDLMCSISDPPISSIVLDVEEGGYMIGKKIHSRITGELTENFNVVIEPTRIELRQSTERININDSNVLRVITYIENNFSKDIRIDSILDDVPLSRRSLEVRFKKETGTTIYQYILRCRCEHLAYMLVTTNRPIIEIAYEAGFTDYNNIARVFKKFYGCSPVEYRSKFVK